MRSAPEIADSTQEERRAYIKEKFAKSIIDKSGHVDYLINNAIPMMKGVDECSYEEN